MRGIGVHVCGGCGRVYNTLDPYLDCAESHITAMLRVTTTKSGEDIPLLHLRLDPACLSWTVERDQPIRPRLDHEDDCLCGQLAAPAPGLDHPAGRGEGERT